jgi:transketolase
VAVGTGLGLRALGRPEPRVFTLVGDAELDEAPNHEAIAFAGAIGLDNVHAVIVDNASATHSWSGGVGTRFEREGAARHPDRVINVGIREQLLAGVTGGLAPAGRAGAGPTGRVDHDHRGILVAPRLAMPGASGSMNGEGV